MSISFLPLIEKHLKEKNLPKQKINILVGKNGVGKSKTLRSIASEWGFCKILDANEVWGVFTKLCPKDVDLSSNSEVGFGLAEVYQLAIALVSQKKQVIVDGFGGNIHPTWLYEIVENTLRILEDREALWMSTHSLDVITAFAEVADGHGELYKDCFSVWRLVNTLECTPFVVRFSLEEVLLSLEQRFEIR